MQKASAYYRVSTEQQDLQRQKVIVHDAAIRLGFDIVAEFEDKLSGSFSDRESFKRLQEWVKENPGSFVLASEQDRFSRGVGPWNELNEVCRQYNVTILPLNIPDTGDLDMNDLLRNIMAAFSGFDRRNIVKKMFSGRITKLKQGIQIVGHKVPYGYQYVPENEKNKVVVDPEEAKIVLGVYDMFVNQYYSFNKIIQTLNDRKVITKTGLTHWNAATIKFMLTNRTYLGEWVWNKYRNKTKFNAIKTENDLDQQIILKVDPIVPEKLFNQAQELLKSPRYQRKTLKHVYLLNRVVYCGKCGKRYNAYLAGNKFKYYRCSSRRLNGYSVYCRNRVQNVDRLDNYIWKWLVHLVVSQDGKSNVNKILELEKKREGSLASFREDLKTIEVELKKLNERYLSADEMVSKGKINNERYVSLVSRLDEAKAELLEKHKQLETKIEELNKLSPVSDTFSEIDQFAMDLYLTQGKNMEQEKKQQIVNAFIDKIHILPERERVKVEFKLPFSSLDPSFHAHVEEKISIVDLVPKKDISWYRLHSHKLVRFTETMNVLPKKKVSIKSVKMSQAFL